MSVTALEQAIKLNNVQIMGAEGFESELSVTRVSDHLPPSTPQVSVSSNLLAFQWGRAIALQPELATEDTSTDTSTNTSTTEVTTDAHNPTSAGTEPVRLCVCVCVCVCVVVRLGLCL